MAIEAVVFDIGKVLIGWDPEGFYDSRIGPDRRRALFEEVDLHAMNLGIDHGDPFRASVEGLAARHPDWADEISLWHDCWDQMVGPPIARSVRTMSALRRRGVPVHALTNFGAETFEIALGLFPFLNEFDTAFVSARMRLLKPQPEIYAAVEESTGLPPDRLLFTDDRPENVDAAAARGWQTHLFEGPDAWADRLVTEGLLTEEEAA